MSHARSLLAGVAILVTGVVFTSGAMGATTFAVNTTADTLNEPGSCSLRQAFNALTGDGGPDQACGAVHPEDTTIALPAGTYKITREGRGSGNQTGDFYFAGGPFTGDYNITIEPKTPGEKVVIDADGLDRAFYLAGSKASFTLRNLTITGGSATSEGSSGSGTQGAGGAIFTTLIKKLTLDGVTISGNQATGLGGGIGARGSDAGGTASTNIEIVNSTISGNSTLQSGGGIGVQSQFGGAAATATVRSSTIIGNTADSDGDNLGTGGGVAAVGSPVSGAGGSHLNLTNTILAGNFHLSPSAVKSSGGKAPYGSLFLHSPDCYVTGNFAPRYLVTTQALDQGNCQTSSPPVASQVVSDAKLGPLADNGGPTQTLALLTGSPAIGAGGSAAPDLCPGTDQRGTARPAGKCDIGAFQTGSDPGPGPDPDPEPGPKPLPPLKNPNNTTATFDGKNLHIRLKCPARFKPKCASTVVPSTKKKGGKPMAKAKKVTTRSNKWKRVSFLIKPAFRATVQKMTTVDRKQLVVRQVVKSKRVGKRKAKKPARVFHVYKVRTKA